MPLYLAEVFLNRRSPEKLKEGLAVIHEHLTGGKLPAGVTLKAGPWFSNEDLKIVSIIDIADHSVTFPRIAGNIVNGLVEGRRLTPIVDWKSVESFLNESK